MSADTKPPIRLMPCSYSCLYLRPLRNLRSMPCLACLHPLFSDRLDPKDLAEGIVENIEAGLNNFRTVLAALGKWRDFVAAAADLSNSRDEEYSH